LIFQFTKFSGKEYPHWDIAYIEAEDEEAARCIMRDELFKAVEYSETSKFSETLWGHYAPETEWVVVVAAQPLLFVMGGACRGGNY
jgi:hypothetical protein